MKKIFVLCFIAVLCACSKNSNDNSTSIYTIRNGTSSVLENVVTGYLGPTVSVRVDSVGTIQPNIMTGVLKGKRPENINHLNIYFKKNGKYYMVNDSYLIVNGIELDITDSTDIVEVTPNSILYPH